MPPLLQGERERVLCRMLSRTACATGLRENGVEIHAGGVAVGLAPGFLMVVLSFCFPCRYVPSIHGRLLRMADKSLKSKRGRLFLLIAFTRSENNRAILAAN